ncbi:conjugal transfer protein TraD [Burkholderia ubonensis]|uniref:conjugal transfer protein TraD n=1 Tax=Burkholderia ubonensis TaxID=101571 RepID=UPI000F5704FF|nr:conjugal transfer protein TraD [Burkholderia ubonensis]RQP38477.1 conjugal transfer protein TraD [Burkholderia ubonensis]RQP38796.1 conjugal transfer protein TraD [Burkholderia ubonensis]RQP42933.1 conjugal transfer protein TraD [Burkholderia ubonensis]RQP57349.1 conjugal transfer protein TraD [Burkholderia ubonensis]RQP62247.1 conjugal transfer protein TraD [Burkholderia ubonensis]
MSELNLKTEIEAIELTTKAAKLRKLMPTIEAKLAEGVRAAEVVETLRRCGLDLTIGTFRNYLHQYRVKHRRGGTPASSPSCESVSYETDSEVPKSHEAVSIQELDRVMKPDPAKQAEDMARYERIGRQQLRGRKR